MNNTYLVITSIASQEHKIINQIAKDSSDNNIPFIMMGDTKSPAEFHVKGCDFYSVEAQKKLHFKLAEDLPYKHYARKNLGYLVAMERGAEIIIETDDDNIPLPAFWGKREKKQNVHLLNDQDWVNIYGYFTDKHIWPRGFSLEHIRKDLPKLKELTAVECPIQQGLADENPDVDAIYRLLLPLPVTFDKRNSIALGNNTICPFNSQNTTWFKEAFPLLYLPSYCSFRMTDIWRSFIAQRIAWTCGWPILFHNSTVWQERNDHNLMKDFNDEIPGYNFNVKLVETLINQELKQGVEYIFDNLIVCYKALVKLGFVEEQEIILLNAWISDLKESTATISTSLTAS